MFVPGCKSPRPVDFSHLLHSVAVVVDDRFRDQCAHNQQGEHASAPFQGEEGEKDEHRIEKKGSAQPDD